ncbi:MAG: hypothetical protein WA055_02610 [Candidatus Moraniibacteriota bacterium]
MSNITHPAKITDSQKGYLALPFNGEQLKQFITGLLGTPQTITKRIKGNFELSLKDLQNFHDLIDQRITQQNNGYLLTSRAILLQSISNTLCFEVGLYLLRSSLNRFHKRMNISF